MQIHVKSCAQIAMQSRVKVRTHRTLLFRLSLLTMLVCAAPNVHAMLRSTAVRLAKMPIIQAPAMRALRACMQSPGGGNSINLSAKRFHKDTASKISTLYSKQIPKIDDPSMVRAHFDLTSFVKQAGNGAQEGGTLKEGTQEKRTNKSEAFEMLKLLEKRENEILQLIDENAKISFQYDLELI